MRKLKLQVQMSVDGYVAGPNGEMDWMESNWDEKLKDYIRGITDPVDCVLLGRKLAEVFIPYWTQVAETPDDPDVWAGKKFTETHKVVFTKTLENHQWDNTVLAKRDIADEINTLKKQEGGDIMAYGGASFVSALIRHRLVDEFYFLIDPTVAGNGMQIFHEIEGRQNLQLIQSASFDCGIVVLSYKPRPESCAILTSAALLLTR